MNNKKFVIANSLSFVFFSLYFLTYVFLVFITRDYKNLLFLFVPSIFLMALLINLSIKYNQLETSTISKISKFSAILNILINGLSTAGSSLFVGTMDWEEKKEEIERYPSIVPAWLFCILVCTLFANFIFFFLLGQNSTITFNIIVFYSVISFVFLFMAQISSTLALIYSNDKKYAVKSWRNILIVFLGLIVIVLITAGPSIYDEIKIRKEKQEFEEHVNNIKRVLNE